MTVRRRIATRRPSDPVTRYANAVRNGKRLVGRAVRMACERHLRDIGRQGTRTFPFTFDAVAAKHIINFYPRFLTLESGAAFKLLDWQAFCLGSLFGWKRSDGGRRFQRGYIETGKGSGKTPMLAGVGLYGLLCDDEESAEIYSAAFDRQQASIALNDAIRMANASPDLSAILDIGKYNIAHPESRSFFRAVSSEHRSKSGPRPHFALADEVHETSDGEVINRLIAGFKGRWQPMGLEITNAGVDRASICWQHHEHSLSVLEQTVEDEQWFAYVCQLDPCDVCFADGHRQPRDGCADCDDWTDPVVWAKTNPSLGVTIQESYLQTQVDRAIAMPSDRALVQRLNFCLWTDTHVIWIAPDDWNACRVPALSTVIEGARAAAFDMSEKLDLTACVVGKKTEDHVSDAEPQTLEIIEVEGTAEVKKTFKLNFYLDLWTYFWLPEETLRARVRTERIPYDIWCESGYLRVTPGPVIDYDQIFDEFTKEIGPMFRPQRVGYDPHNATQFALQLRDKAKYTVVEIGQGRKLSESFKLFEALVRLRRIRHNGNLVMGFCVGNAEPKRDRYQNLWIEKPSATKRIDGLIAAVMVLNQLMVMPVRSQRDGRGLRVWTPSGWQDAIESPRADA